MIINIYLTKMETLSKGIILTNNEFIERKEIEEKVIYIFRGVNDEVFNLIFDEHEKYFKIVRTDNDFTYSLKCENSYRTPDLKKLIVAFKFKNIIDEQNVFHYEGLKIVNISTTFESFYDEKTKKNVYTKIPKYYTYLLEYNGHFTILSYNDKKYSSKSINMINNY